MKIVNTKLGVLEFNSQFDLASIFLEDRCIQVTIAFKIEMNKVMPLLRFKAYGVYYSSTDDKMHKRNECEFKIDYNVNDITLKKIVNKLYDFNDKYSEYGIWLIQKSKTKVRFGKSQFYTSFRDVYGEYPTQRTYSTFEFEKQQ